MTQEDKELLLKDLCARLPYGVIIKHKDEHGKSIDARLVGYNGDWFNYYIDDLCFHLKIHEFKPYLRPMSSMTEEERNNLRVYCRTQERIIYDIGVAGAINCPAIIDFFNAHHLDYHGLIEKGLALKALEGMYNES